MFKLVTIGAFRLLSVALCLQQSSSCANRMLRRGDPEESAHLDLTPPTKSACSSDVLLLGAIVFDHGRLLIGVVGRGTSKELRSRKTERCGFGSEAAKELDGITV